jgi:hypothetical protein
MGVHDWCAGPEGSAKRPNLSPMCPNSYVTYVAGIYHPVTKMAMMSLVLLLPQRATT